MRTVELLEGDGSVRYPWPVEMDDHNSAAFLASPTLHDVDGDGVKVLPTNQPAKSPTNHTHPQNYCSSVAPQK